MLAIALQVGRVFALAAAADDLDGIDVTFAQTAECCVVCVVTSGKKPGLTSD